MSFESFVATLASGPFVPDEISIVWNPQARLSPSASTARSIEERWRDLRRSAAEAHEPFPNRRLCRLQSWEAGESRLSLTLGPTTYKELMGTNRNPEVLHTHPPREALSNAMGVCSAVITSDNYLIIQRRSEDLLQFPGLLHVCGGMLEPVGESPLVIDPVAHLLAELCEELGIDRDDVRSCICLGLLEDPKTRQPELVFQSNLNVPVKRFDRAWGPEHKAIVLLCNQGSALAEFVLEHRSGFVPVGLGCLALSGKLAFGDAWFRELDRSLAASGGLN